MARDVENKRITKVMSLQRVGKVGGSSRLDTDGHDPYFLTPTRQAESPMARDFENKRINMYFQKVGKVGGSSRSDTNEHELSAIVSDCERQKKSKRMIRVMSLLRIRKSLL